MRIDLGNELPKEVQKTIIELAKKKEDAIVRYIARDGIYKVYGMSQRIACEVSIWEPKRSE